MDFFASPNGSGDGSKDNPWPLSIALSQTTKILPGSKLYLLEGTYIGNFLSKLSGVDGQPVEILPLGNVTLDGSPTNLPVLKLAGQYSVVKGLEATNSDPNRIVNVDSAGRGNGIEDAGRFNKVINCLVHDCGQGIVSQTGGEGSEYYGNIIYNNGWSKLDGMAGGNGHGFYLQNSFSIPKLVRQNIVFGNYNNGIDMHTGTFNKARSLIVEGNVSFLDRTNLQATGSLGDELVVRRHYSWAGDTNFLSGTYALKIEDCYLAAALPFAMTNWTGGGVIQRNKIIGRAGTGGALFTWYLKSGQVLPAGFVFDFNSYWRGRIQVPGYNVYPGGSYTFEQWQGLGFDANSAKVDGEPAETEIFIEPNIYDNRANVIIYNWANSPTVQLDLSQILSAGQDFEIRNGADYSQIVFQGTYNGPIDISLSGLTIAQVLGDAAKIRNPTSPSFAVLVVIGKQTTPEPVPEPIPEPIPEPEPMPEPIPEPLPTRKVPWPKAEGKHRAILDAQWSERYRLLDDGVYGDWAVFEYVP